MSKAPQFDPLYRLILIGLGVFLVGLILTNEQARSAIMHPF